MLDDRARIRGHDIFIRPDPDDQRAALAGHHQRIRLILAGDGDAVGAFHLMQRRLHRARKKRCAGRKMIALLQVRIHIADQHRQHFGIGLAFEGMAFVA